MSKQVSRKQVILKKYYSHRQQKKKKKIRQFGKLMIARKKDFPMKKRLFYKLRPVKIPENNKAVET